MRYLCDEFGNMTWVNVAIVILPVVITELGEWMRSRANAPPAERLIAAEQSLGDVEVRLDKLRSRVKKLEREGPDKFKIKYEGYKPQPPKMEIIREGFNPKESKPRTRRTTKNVPE